MKNLLFVMIGCVFLAGCVAPVPTIGSGEPSDPPPQIVFLGATDSAGTDYLTWKNVSSFGAVSDEVKPIGDMSCMQFDIQLRASGYHPGALDRKGNPIPGGGFYCSPFTLDLVGAEPPQLIERDGVLAWDRPGAFAAVPSELTQIGRDVCSAANPDGYALGWRSDALDLNGQPLAEGGFLCSVQIEIEDAPLGE